MGRGPGNAQTEYLAVELTRRGLADIDVVPILPIVTGDFAELQQHYGWGANVYYFLSAAHGIHPTYIQEMTKDGRYGIDEIVAAVAELGDAGGASFSRKRLEAATADSSLIDPDGTWSADGLCEGRYLEAALPDLAVYPVIRCAQEIPCNPCATVCKKHSIEMQGDPILGRPEFIGPECTGCTKCVTICPGLAITMVDGRKDPDFPIVSVPFEQSAELVPEGMMALATDQEGNLLGNFEVVGVKNRKFADRTLLVQLRVPRQMAPLIAGIRTQDPDEMMKPVELMADGSLAGDVIICRCEHVTAGEIRESIKDGTRDVNELKAELRVCMGACCGKNCPEHIARIFRELGVEAGEVTTNTIRPLFVEVPFGVFASGSKEPE